MHERGEPDRRTSPSRRGKGVPQRRVGVRDSRRIFARRERNRRGAAVRQYHRLERKRGGPSLHPARPPPPRRTKALLLSGRRRRKREWIRGGHHPHVFAAKRRVSANRQRIRQRAA